MRILLLGQHFYPENVSGAVLATQLAESLVERGHVVTFATCFPSYPKGIVFQDYRGKIFSREMHVGAQVVRTWSYTSPKKTTGRRLANYASFSATVFFSGLAAGQPDVIMSYSPPLPLGLTAWTLSRLRRVPWVLRVEDLFPEAAINVGVIRNPFVIRLLEAFERFLYQEATHISVISEGFRRQLLAKGVPPRKVSVIPVWADPNEVRPLPKQTVFRQEHGLQDKFVILYSGTLGYTCALEDALEAARLLKGEDSIRLVIVGEGVKKADLQDMAQVQQLSNVIFLPFQPRARYPELLASADVALVTLNVESSTTSLPGKTFNYLASGRPIVAVTPLDSEIAQFVREARCGVSVPPGQPEYLARVILELKLDGNRLAEMGQNARLQLESHFSRQRCVGLYEKMFRQVMG
jgi:colanic acid biosynthesis glycosyl transferase WcaI